MIVACTHNLTRAILLLVLFATIIAPVQIASAQGSQLAAPDVKVKSDIGEITVTWNDIPDATHYAIYRDGDDEAHLLATTRDLCFVDTGLTDGETYSYRVQARGGNETTPLLSPLSVERSAVPGSASVTGRWGWVLALVGGFIQLVLGIALAMVSIYLGLNVLGRLVPKIRIFDEIAKGNLAVAIVAAGVVVAYTQVISNGIRGMAAAVSTNPDLAGFIAGLISVALGMLFASLGITLAFKVLDRITVDIDEEEHLKKRNLAVGLLVAGVLYAVSSMIAAAVSGIGTAISAGLGASGFI